MIRRLYILNLPRWLVEVVQMTTEKFDKEYGYSIRHNFGKEGKRVVRFCIPRAKILVSESRFIHLTMCAFVINLQYILTLHSEVVLSSTLR